MDKIKHFEVPLDEHAALCNLVTTAYACCSTGLDMEPVLDNGKALRMLLKTIQDAVKRVYVIKKQQAESGVHHVKI